jgi:hypothetical protein
MQHVVIEMPGRMCRILTAQEVNSHIKGHCVHLKIASNEDLLLVMNMKKVQVREGGLTTSQIHVASCAAPAAVT